MDVKLGGAVALSLVLLIVPTWLYFTSSSNPEQTGTNSTTVRMPTSKPTNTNNYLWTFVALHSLYILYRILFSTPLNIFSGLDIPLNAPPNVLREGLLGLVGEEVKEFPPAWDVLLKRLNSFDARTYYMRFGHDALLKCQHCVDFYDYALFALPRPLLEYVRETAVVGLLTSRRSGRLKWRKYAVGVLVLAMGAEVYLTATTVLVVGDGERMKTVQLHDYLWLARHIIYLVLPPVLLLLPPSQDSASALLSSTLPQLTLLADQTLARLHLLKFTHGAAARSPSLRDNSAEWWGRERTEGEWGREDEEVRRTADARGMGYADAGDGGEEVGELRKKARMAVEGLKGGFRPSEYWQQN